MGGLIAQELYRQLPGRVAALVLCDTAAKIGNDESWDARIAKVESNGIESVADSVLQRWFTAEFREHRTDELIGWRLMLTRTPQQGYLAACRAVKRADLRQYASSIAVATLCLVGDQDGSTPVPLVRETAGLIAGSRFEIIDGAGHLPSIERPEAVAALIAEHARRVTT
jgi:3-oxoadipate enol-lactonase